MKENKKNNSRLVIILLIIILAIGVCGWYFLSKCLSIEKVTQEGSSQIQEINEIKENKSLDETYIDEKTPTEKPIVENNLSNENKYFTIINEYKDALKDDKFKNSNDKYPNINTYMILMKKKELNNNNNKYDFDFEYIYYDINKDGQDELVVFAKFSNNMTIIDIYGYDSNNKKPVKIIDDNLSKYSISAFIYNNGMIILLATVGTNTGLVEFTKILSNGYITDTDKFYYKFEDKNTLTFYSSNEDMVNKSNKLFFTTFEDLNNLYVKDAKIIDFTNLTRYKI